MNSETATSSSVGSACLAGAMEQGELPRHEYHDFQASAAGVDGAVVDAVSVDLEDYYHVEAFASRICRAGWGTFASRIRQNTKLTLDVLDRSKCRATFFVLGWIAEREPKLIRELADAGHELACHSHFHRPLHTLRPSEFRADLVRSRDAIENATGVRVVGFRAPTFSITNLIPIYFRYSFSILIL